MCVYIVDVERRNGCRSRSCPNPNDKCQRTLLHGSPFARRVSVVTDRHRDGDDGGKTSFSSCTQHTTTTTGEKTCDRTSDKDTDGRIQTK